MSLQILREDHPSHRNNLLTYAKMALVTKRIVRPKSSHRIYLGMRQGFRAVEMRFSG